MDSMLVLLIFAAGMCAGVLMFAVGWVLANVTDWLFNRRAKR